MKLKTIIADTKYASPAAFGRLCVETMQGLKFRLLQRPAAFGRLCVETLAIDAFNALVPPAAFGRLCVETKPR